MSQGMSYECGATTKDLEMRTPYLAFQGGWRGGGGRPLRPEEEMRGGNFRWEVEMSVPEYKKWEWDRSWMDILGEEKRLIGFSFRHFQVDLVVTNYSGVFINLGIGAPEGTRTEEKGGEGTPPQTDT